MIAANVAKLSGLVRCPLLAQSGHRNSLRQCPLLGVKRTSRIQSVMSAFDPKRTWATAA
jgi:hypothetical protein